MGTRREPGNKERAWEQGESLGTRREPGNGERARGTRLHNLHQGFIWGGGGAIGGGRQLGGGGGAIGRRRGNWGEEGQTGE